MAALLLPSVTAESLPSVLVPCLATQVLYSRVPSLPWPGPPFRKAPCQAGTRSTRRRRAIGVIQAAALPWQL